MTPPPVVLTIAGSDNSCGAGAQADLKTITSLGGYAQTAITCVVAEVPGRVEAIQPLKPSIVAAQVRLSLEAFPVAAAKTGMLFSRGIIRAVANALEAVPHLPLVVDPVMVASSGDPLLEPPAIEAYRRLLFPRATLVTPNLDELRILSGLPCRDLDAMEDAGHKLVERYGCAWLLKGGHLGGRIATDILVSTGGSERFSAPFRRGFATHGTGCTYSAAIATGLACRLALAEAVGLAKRYITAAIESGLRWKAAAALDHRVSVEHGPRAKRASSRA
jgi:hydroxymethylpyrimidine/phosphomethylpyrimidine kinase